MTPFGCHHVLQSAPEAGGRGPDGVPVDGGPRHGDGRPETGHVGVTGLVRDGLNHAPPEVVEC